VELQTKDDSTGGHAYRRYSKGHYLRELPDAAIEAFLLRGTESGDGAFTPGAGLQAHGGAIDDVPDADAAFAHRGTLFEWGAGSRWTDPAEDGARIAAARRAGAALAPFASGVYVNSVGDEGAAGVRRAYPGAKLAKLTTLKDAYDPANVFHLNANIRPTQR
jgi:FAD/FMN-containing dehydrogenase